ncbi:hypothetical protein PMG11_11310 [Penicillium brasilianum]|uniref:Dienelactone hydrolase domain-containing protein n=1 Tax=Penicillium brasilianum TaxID=104259 RepID=A0A0F7U1G6_PENBI|nr:hypothetical protein PMG11_11310 [Penicillium brasilianum]
MGVWQNAKLLADQYAAHGYLCLVPDIFLGDSVPINRPYDFDVKKWIMQGSEGNSPHTPAVIDAIVKKAIVYLTGQHGVVKLGAIGICLGAKYVARHFSSGIAVGFIAHPAFMEEAELESITGPLSIAAAENDYIFTTAKRHKFEEILSNKTPKVPYQICLYSGTTHGFAVRCDLSIPEQKYAKEQAFLQAVNWFDEYLLG